LRPDAHIERVLHEHGQALRRLARAYAWDDAGVDDLMQEIAIALWDALPAFRGECSERTYVFRVARHRALTHRHRHRRATEPLAAAERVEDPAPLADEAAERHAQHEVLMRHVQQLPEGLRSVVVLRLEGMHDAEIAEVLGLSAGNVAVRLTRARAALRSAMTPATGTLR
jgi:RNA polymerase sigma-70 factor (ECF subfamily)